MSDVLSKQRSLASLSTSRLTRARRLYKHLVKKQVAKSPQLAYLLAARGIERGLWSPKTGIGDVAFKLCRDAWKDNQWCDWTTFVKFAEIGSENKSPSKHTRLPLKLRIVA